MLPPIPNGSTTPSELPTDLTLLLPPALVTEVWELLNSQEEFMSRAKQFGAAVLALKTRYDTLTSVWDDLRLVKASEQLTQLRNEARAIQQDLKLRDESVMNDLGLQCENELRRIDESVQEEEEKLSRREKAWMDEYGVKRTSFLRSLRSLKKGLSELRETWSELKKNGELSIIKQRTSYEQQKSSWEKTGSPGASSSGDLPLSEQSLTELRESLTLRKQELQRRRESLPSLRIRWEETVAISQQESEVLTKKRTYLRDLKNQQRAAEMGNNTP